SPSPTPDPFLPYYIETLTARPYGEGPIRIGMLLEETPTFQRYAISYPSDGLHITGYLNLPKGTGPFPVIILNHGYYPPEHYQTGDGTREAADFLAQHGYLTLASDYRNYAGSDHSDNFFRLGFVVDIMNLLASLDTLPAGWADTERVGMWGHSMGGGVTINVVALAGDALDAAVIYGGMSGDMSDATRHVLAVWQRPDYMIPVAAWGGPDERPDAYAHMSALSHLDRAHAALSIHHGTYDEQVPYSWSEKLRDVALTAGLRVEHFAYPNVQHNFSGETWTLFMGRSADFFAREVKGR
ncbi:MAG: alpha/beta fold hydrolase, partial [Chloroflexota bacterium]|nr:alpha/beta fold hydrolase [Chloroflexota bacterium]